MGGRRAMWGVALGMGVWLGGCASSEPGGALSEAPEAGPQATRLAAEAAKVRYPEDVTASDELKVTAVVDRDEHTIAIRNFGDEPLKDLEVWVNGAYVRKVELLPARGGLVIHFGQFYDAQGLNLAEQQVNVSRVQLQEGSKLYNVMGPAYD